MKIKKFDYKLKNNKNKPIIISIVIVMLLLIGVTIYSTYAKYKVTKSYNILQGKVGDFNQSDLTLTVVVVDEEGNESTVEEFPEKEEYTFNYVLSKCDNGSEINFDKETWTASVNATEKDNCTLYFNYGNTLGNVIVEDAIKNNYLYSTSPSFSQATADGEYGLYRAADDYGTSYYFRGDVENNYVEFGTYAEDTTLNITKYDINGPTDTKSIEVKQGSPMYWRIVRVNGDGSVRLIYDGIDKVANGESHTSIIGNAVFHPGCFDVKYSGYTYDDGNDNHVNSTIKSVLDTWYENHLESSYGSYIQDSIFCNDKEASEYTYYDMDGKIIEDAAAAVYTSINYAPYHRLIKSKTPVLTCKNKSDRYTVDDKANGNGLLINPVGLITADEVYLAGSIVANPSIFQYIYNNEEFNWTITPDNFDSSEAWGWLSNTDGGLYTGCTQTEAGVRPVINLKMNTIIEGDGTRGTPYKIK